MIRSKPIGPQIPWIRPLRIYLMVALVGAATPRVQAEEVTFTFSGQVLSVDDSGGTIGGAINPGDPVEGSFTFESTTADQEPDLSTLGKYDFAIVEWDMDIGENAFRLSSFSSIVVQDDTVDRYEIAARLVAPFGDLVWNTFWTFTDPDGNLFSSDALPTAAPDVLPFQTADSVLFFDEAPAVVAVQLDQFTSDGSEVVTGDMDCDGDVDFDDIDDFVMGLTNAEGYEAIYGVPPSLKGDTDGNGSIDFDDIAGFVGLLTGASAAAAQGHVAAQAIPEPATGLLAMLLVGCLAGGRPAFRGRCGGCRT